ncbi:DNA cytosine methyltransferase [Paracoccus sp. XHP0099]|uniref:DNA cytosine methyltransferase n=1 Tax=Paracoccus marinaquae TaxID=2841926 RepID=A0ABS6AGL5_9RHOB|nr:DNA cytosine methyltransferase [Paracoccus marinaquae]
MVSRPRHGLSLCAGGGGLDMGLMLAEPGFHTRAFVEWEEWPRAVLVAAQRAGYFAPAPIWDDLRSFDSRPFRGAFDIVLAGYPCQPFSAAGRRGGAKDPRHLWPEVARIIRECVPEWVFLENVPGHVSLGLETVLRELWDMGYTPAAGLFSAAEVGAPHQRLRIFILAHNDEPASRRGQLQSSRAQRHRAEGQSIGAGHYTAACGAMADPGSAELEGQQPGQHHAGRWQVPDGSPALPGRAGLHPPRPGNHAAWAAILAARPDLAPALGFDDCLAWACRVSADPESPGTAAAQSALRRMADGLAHRARALRLLGNGVHPLAAAHAWRSLAAAHGLGPVDLATERGPGSDEPL